MSKKAPINPATGKRDWDYTPPTRHLAHEEYLARMEQEDEELIAVHNRMSDGRSDGLPSGKYGYRDDFGNFIEQDNHDGWDCM